MTKDEVKKLFIDDVEARKSAISDYIMDLSHSYEDRLEVWQKTPEHLYTSDGWVINLSDFESKYGEISWYSDFNVERHEEVYLPAISERADDWDDEKIQAFNEACMSLGIHSFTFDW